MSYEHLYVTASDSQYVDAVLVGLLGETGSGSAATFHHQPKASVGQNL